MTMIMIMGTMGSGATDAIGGTVVVGIIIHNLVVHFGTSSFVIIMIPTYQLLFTNIHITRGYRTAVHGGER